MLLYNLKQYCGCKYQVDHYVYYIETVDRLIIISLYHCLMVSRYKQDVFAISNNAINNNIYLLRRLSVWDKSKVIPFEFVTINLKTKWIKSYI